MGTLGGSFGIGVGTKALEGAAIASLPPVPFPSSGALTLGAANALLSSWYGQQSGAFVSQMAAWLKARGISSGYFSFTQDVEIQKEGVATPSKEVAVWSGMVQPSGNAMYGAPQIVDSAPTFLDVVYWSMAASSDLPAGWAYQQAGQLEWRVVDAAFTPLTSWSSIQTGGAYDESETDQSTNSQALLCLVDRTGLSGCPGTTNVRDLMDQAGASGSMLTYVRQLHPVYQPIPDGSGDVQPVISYEYDQRNWMCTYLENKGSVGYELTGSVDRFYVSVAAPRYTASPVATAQFNALSATQPFDLTVQGPALGGQDPSAVLISPLPPTPGSELWSIPSYQASRAVYIAPLYTPPPQTVTSTYTYQEPVQLYSPGDFGIGSDSDSNSVASVPVPPAPATVLSATLLYASSCSSETCDWLNGAVSVTVQYQTVISGCADPNAPLPPPAITSSELMVFNLCALSGSGCYIGGG